MFLQGCFPKFIKIIFKRNIRMIASIFYLAYIEYFKENIAPNNFNQSHLSMELKAYF